LRFSEVGVTGAGPAQKSLRLRPAPPTLGYELLELGVALGDTRASGLELGPDLCGPLGETTVALPGALQEPHGLRASPLAETREELHLCLATDELLSQCVDVGAQLLREPVEPFQFCFAPHDTPIALARPPGESHGLGAPPVGFQEERRELTLPVGKQLIGRRQLRPLLLQLRQERLFGGWGRPAGLQVRNGLERRPRLGRPLDRHDLPPALSVVTAFDLCAQTSSESRLRRELDSVLGRQRPRQRRARDEAELDDDLAEPPTGRRLVRERTLELLVGEQASLDQ
jgi:hypothetical protein